MRAFVLITICLCLCLIPTSRSEAYLVATSGAEVVTKKTAPAVWQLFVETDAALIQGVFGVRGAGGAGSAVMEFEGECLSATAACFPFDGTDLGPGFESVHDVLYVQFATVPPLGFPAAPGVQQGFGRILVPLPEQFGVGFEPNTPFTEELVLDLFGLSSGAYDFAAGAPVPTIFVSVPEPGSLFLLLAASAGLGWLRARRCRD